MINQVEFINEYTGKNHQVRSTHLLEDFMSAKKEISEKGLDYILLTETKEAFDKLMEVDAHKPQQWDFSSRVFSMPEYFVDYTKITANIKTPVLVINGTKDVAIGKDHPKDFKFPNMKIKNIEGSHMLYYEKNINLITEIKKFIN